MNMSRPYFSMRLQGAHEKFGLGMKLPMNLLYTGISAFHFRFHFYREALLERIQEIEGDETFYPVTDL